MKKSKTKLKRERQHQNKLAHDEIVRNYEIQEKTAAIKKDFDDAEDKNILDKFAEEHNKKEPIIELFDIKNIKLKANITDEQRNTICILMAAYNKAASIGKEYGVYINLASITNICSEFIEMSPSLEGKRAEQYVDAHKAQINQFMNQMPQSGYGNYSPQMQGMRR